MFRRFALLILFALAFAGRVAYAWQYSDLPFADGAIGDSAVYLRQATAVLAGRHGDAALLAMSPLPGYFIALFEAKAAWVIAAQLVLGFGCALILARLTLRAFGEVAAIGAVALYVGYGLFPFYETKLLGETLGFALALAALDLVLEAPRRRGGWSVAIGAGVAMGLAVLARASMIFAAALLPLFALLPVRRDEAGLERLERGGSVLLGTTLVIVGRGLLALAYTGTFVAVLYTAPELEGARELRPETPAETTSVVGRSASPTGHGAAAPPTAEGRPPSALGPRVRTAWEMVDAVEARLAAHTPAPPLWETARAIDLGAMLRRAPRKLLETFRDVEASYQYAYYGERAHLLSLNLYPVSFPWIALLALFGAVALVRRGEARVLAVFAPMVLGTLVTTVLYMPIARYRLPMLVSLLPLGGVGIEALVEGLRARKPVAFAGVAAALLVFVPTAYRNIHYTSHHPERWQLVLAESYANHHPPKLERASEAIDAAVSEIRARGETPSPAFDARVHAIFQAAAANATQLPPGEVPSIPLPPGLTAPGLPGHPSPGQPGPDGGPPDQAASPEPPPAPGAPGQGAPTPGQGPPARGPDGRWL